MPTSLVVCMCVPECNVHAWLCVCVRARMCVCVCARVCVSVCVCTCVCTCIHGYILWLYQACHCYRSLRLASIVMPGAGEGRLTFKYQMCLELWSARHNDDNWLNLKCVHSDVHDQLTLMLGCTPRLPWSTCMCRCRFSEFNNKGQANSRDESKMPWSDDTWCHSFPNFGTQTQPQVDL